MLRVAGCSLLLIALAPAFLIADDVESLAKQLRELDGRVIVLGTVRQPPLAGMLARHAEAGLRAANRADLEAWSKLRTREDWEAFRTQKLRQLQASLGTFPPVPSDLQVRVTGRHAGDGFTVQNLVFVTRPGLVATANLYFPAKFSGKAPGILICHSHQSTKHSGARQDMAMTWARAGCVVLMPDHLGHGERREHPFGGEGQHDYHFRYDMGLQFHLVGESLMGWLVWDLMRCVDMLTVNPNVDSKRIVLISEPAGGGDVAAVTAAIDHRIVCAMVQNFGGPQPETSFPLSADAEQSFAFAGSGSWESTRNLRLSAGEGFLPWSIVAAIAPRKLIYFHEFYWDRESDPVWKRLQQVYAWQEQRDSLVGIAGRGFVVGSAPENTHWLPENRALLYPVLEKWLKIPNPGQEYSQRMPEQDLHCRSIEFGRNVGALPVNLILNKIATERIQQSHERVAKQTQPWLELLGNSAAIRPINIGETIPLQNLGSIQVERLHLRSEPGIVVPALLLRPIQPSARSPLVIGVAQQGKEEFLKQRADELARLLRGGAAVCLLDVRGTGETSPGEDRGRRSAATSISATELMLRRTVLGGQLHDLRAVMQHLRSRNDLDLTRVALWAESFQPTNAADVKLDVPHTGARPASPEPMGALLALFAALAEPDVRAVYVHRGLFDFQSALKTSYCYLPHDAVIPGFLANGDLADLMIDVAPRKVWLNEPVDSANRAVTAATFSQSKYHGQGHVRFTSEAATAADFADWILHALKE